MQPAMTVSGFLAQVNDALKIGWDAALPVEGEVSNYRVSQGQWVSFDLKDESALVNVFMTVWNLTVPIEDGIKVRVYGQPRVYAKYGKFSLSAERVELSGEGALKKALAALRLRLDKEGLFDPSRKRPLPRFPHRIALVASRESAAYGDFVRVIGERWGGLEIDLYHVIVQGDKAPNDIVGAIEAAQAGEYDALVLTRGGGSFDELMAFNDERVVRAVHGSRIPTLVAIGHERDLSLAEEAADVRGSTPTDCARRLVPDRRDALYEIASTVESISATWVRERLGVLDRATRQCEERMEQWMRRLQDRFDADLRLLSSLDPTRVLARGYALVRDAAGRVVASSRKLKLGDALTVRLSDGEIGTSVTRTGSTGPVRPSQASLL